MYVPVMSGDVILCILYLPWPSQLTIKSLAIQSHDIFCFNSDFIQSNYEDTFHFSSKTSGYIAGAVYDVSMLLGPFMGVIVVSNT